MRVAITKTKQPSKSTEPSLGDKNEPREISLGNLCYRMRPVAIKTYGPHFIVA